MSKFFHGYINKQLTPDEHVLYRGHISWVPLLLRMAPITVIAAAVGGFVWGLTSNFWLGILVFLVLILIGLLSQRKLIHKAISTDIAVTNRRFTSKENIIKVNNKESSLSRIDDTQLRADSVLQRIFNYGDISIQTLGGEPYDFKDVARPTLLKEAINTAKDEYAGWGGESAANARFANARPAPRASDPQTLKRDNRRR